MPNENQEATANSRSVLCVTCLFTPQKTGLDQFLPDGAQCASFVPK